MVRRGGSRQRTPISAASQVPTTTARGEPGESPATRRSQLSRRASLAGLAGLAALRKPVLPASAYGLSVAPPPSSTIFGGDGGKRSYNDIMKARDEAERRQGLGLTMRLREFPFQHNCAVTAVLCACISPT